MVDLIAPVCQGRSSDNYYTTAPASRPCRNHTDEPTGALAARVAVSVNAVSLAAVWNWPWRRFVAVGSRAALTV